MEDQGSDELQPQRGKFQNYGGMEDMVSCPGINAPTRPANGSTGETGHLKLPRMDRDAASWRYK